MNNLFYRAFEDRHRGSRELIKERLRAYLPFLHPLASALAPASALDLGCGRGEWLELLGEQGFKAQGVDLDEGMLAACRERGLDVATQDALSGLRAQPDASLALVSGFHLVEHIDFDDVQTLIIEALRVLQPGGLLIMETPNPENLVVATSGFYMDPSHLRPIPPQLLEFVVEFHGFERHRVVRLQEPAQLAEPAGVALLNVINAVSPDYSVVAQKAAPAPIAQQFDHAFSVEFGLTLDALAERYDAQRNAAQHALRHDLSVLGERMLMVEQSSGELFKRTLDTIHAAQASTHAVQHELDVTRQRERHFEKHAHVLALTAAEARLAQSLSQADLTAQRLLLAEQRALQAEQDAAAARSELQKVEQLAERVSRETESTATLNANKLLELTQRKLEDAEQLAAEASLQAAEAEQHAMAAEKRAMEAEQRINSATHHAEATHQVRHELAQAHADMHHLRNHLRDVQSYADRMEQQIRDMYASSSWRMTKPARAAMSILLKVRKRAPDSAEKTSLPIALPQPASPSIPPLVGMPISAVSGSNDNGAPAPQAIPVAGLSPEAEKVFQQLLRSAQSDQSAK